MTKMNDFQRFLIQLWCERGVGNDENERLPNPVFNDSLYIWCETGVGNDENERFPNPVLSDCLYSFDAKQMSEMMKMNDFRIRF